MENQTRYRKPLLFSKRKHLMPVGILSKNILALRDMLNLNLRENLTYSIKVQRLACVGIWIR